MILSFARSAEKKTTNTSFSTYKKLPEIENDSVNRLSPLSLVCLPSLQVLHNTLKLKEKDNDHIMTYIFQSYHTPKCKQHFLFFKNPYSHEFHCIHKKPKNIGSKKSFRVPLPKISSCYQVTQKETPSLLWGFCSSIVL
jgi:hypothetical protein